MGYVITPQELKPNPEPIKEITDLSEPQTVTQVRRFRGLASYYRRFISKFTATAQPLHLLTHKNVSFQWYEECQFSFESLKIKLTQAPVLAYLSVDVPFVLETDAGVLGLGAALSQKQADNQLHPFAYASRSLSYAERIYSATELETLTVVWAVSHLHAYLYGHVVTAYTDHSAVTAVQGTPSPNGKHARWWTSVFGSGIQIINIVYRPGKENKVTDALSRNPQTGVQDKDVDQTTGGYSACYVHGDTQHPPAIIGRFTQLYGRATM